MEGTRAAFVTACRDELDALKPGNVHRWADGHRMTMADFVRSARAAAPPLAEPGAAVGRRVLKAVEATWQAVGMNTNLGILLLCAPLASAAEQAGRPLPEACRDVLAGLDRQDAADVFAAIRIANPGGLGAAASQDVARPPTVDLRQAMMLAQERDRIAWNYAHGFPDLFTTGLPLLDALLARGWTGGWPLTGVFLDLLRRVPDTHVARKHGLAAARELRAEVAPLADAVLAADDPAAYERTLLDLDRRLKERSINPGTSADVTVAVRFASLLQHKHGS